MLQIASVSSLQKGVCERVWLRMAFKLKGDQVAGIRLGQVSSQLQQEGLQALKKRINSGF